MCFGEAYKPAFKDSQEQPENFTAFNDVSCKVLADGVSVCINPPWTAFGAPEVVFDLNGNRAPNKAGYDLFSFSIYNDGSLAEVNPGERQQWNRSINCIEGIIPNYAVGCFTYLQRNGFKIDY